MTDKINDGGPAYPLHIPAHSGHGPHDFEGMTLRDWFAGQAMQGLLAGQYRDDSRYNRSEVVDESYEIADAMIAARKESNDE